MVSSTWKIFTWMFPPMAACGMCVAAKCPRAAPAWPRLPIPVRICQWGMPCLTLKNLEFPSRNLRFLGSRHQNLQRNVHELIQPLGLIILGMDRHPQDGLISWETDPYDFSIEWIVFRTWIKIAWGAYMRLKLSIPITAVSYKTTLTHKRNMFFVLCTKF